MSEVPSAPAALPVKGRYFALLLLIVVYTLNFLDRQILSILAVPIKTEFGLNDTQLGLLGGISFGAVYSILAIPAAFMADRWSRTWIMTGALALWSAFTAGCGLATSYSMLFFARMGVGIGEAGGVAPAYSLIADYFPVKTRARALAVYSFGIPMGAAAGLLFGAFVAKAVNWRFAFIAIGVAGLVLAPIFRFLVKEPPRAVAVSRDQLGLVAIAGIAARKPSFWLLSIGAGCSSLVGYGLMFWLPSFLVRTLKMELVNVSEFLAAIMLVGGVIGIGLGGILADKLGGGRKGIYPLIPAIAFTISAPLYVLGVLNGAPQNTFWLFVIPQALGLMWLGPVLTAVQHLAPKGSRSQMSALFLLINNLIGLGVGPYFFGKMSDLLKPQFGTESIKYSFICGLGFYGLAALLFFIASFRIKKDWVDDA